MDYQFGYILPRDILKIYPKSNRIRCQGQRCINRPETIDRKRANRGSSLIRKFMEHFSAAGVNRIYRSRSYWRKIAWCIFVVASLFSMSYMTYKVVKEYLEYKKTAQTTNVILSSLEFPAVTICSQITLPKSRAADAGIEKLVRLEKFLQKVEKVNDSYDRQECKRNLTCTWSWFNSQCECLANPCQSEYCEAGYPICSCSALLCDQYPGSCFHLGNSSRGDDEVCFCKNRTLDGDREDEYEVQPRNDEKEVLEHIKDKEVRDTIAYIRNSTIDDLSDIAWVFQPNIYNLANYGTAFDNVIFGCSFQKTDCGRRNFTIIYSPSHGKCYSFNYVGKYSKNPGQPLETRKFGWNSGLQLYLKTRDIEVIDILTRELGVTVVVHDPRELPYVSEYGLALRIGDSAALRLQRTEINRLGYPWGRCLESGEHLPFNYSDVPYSQMGCLRTCQNFYINKRCQCYRRTFLLATVSRPRSPDQIRVCNFNVPKEKRCAEEVTELIENETIACNCYQACNERVYSTSLTAGYMNKDYFRLVKASKTLRLVNDENLTASDSSRRNDILGLRVYYGTLSLQNLTESPGYSWEMLISNIGGNLGFFTGITLMTFVELAELFWDLVMFIVKVPLIT